MKSLIQSLLLVAVFCACASDSYQRVPLPSQSVELSSPSMCRIYVLRMPQVKGAIRALRVEEDEREIGRIGSDSYVCWERTPGRSLVVLTYEGTAFSKDYKQSMIDVQAQAGEVHYYGITIDDTWSKAIVTRLEPDDARAALKGQDPAPKH